MTSEPPDAAVTEMPPLSAWGELRNEGALVAACAIGFGLSLSGLPFYTLGVFVDPLRAAFGWSVASIQAGLTVSFLTTMLALPAVAWATDRFGPRRVALTSLTLMGLAFMSLGLSDRRVWLYDLHWVVIALCGTGSLAITWTRTITVAFKAGRGLALGLALLGTGVMGVVGPPAARALIDGVGWRWAYVWLGAAPILLAVPPTWLFFRTPRAQAMGSTPSRGQPARLDDPRLIVFGVAFVLVALSVAGVIPNLIKVCTSGGLTRAQAVGAASVVGVFVVLGRVGCGALMDRFWAPGVAALFLLGSACACGLLAAHPLKPGFATLAAALVGLSAGAEFDLLPFLVARYFPIERFTRTLGLVSSIFYLGAAVGAPALGWVYDRFGSYGPGMLGAAAAFTPSAVTFLALGPYPRRGPIA